MTPTKIIQQLCELVDDKTILENEEYKKQDEEYGKWTEILERYLNIKEDKELFRIYNNFCIEQGCLEGVTNELYFKEGFLCGARLALEIMFDSKRG